MPIIQQIIQEKLTMSKQKISSNGSEVGIRVVGSELAFCPTCGDMTI